MKQALGVMAILLLSGCGAGPQQDEGSTESADIQMLRKVQEGHLCDPSALMEVIAREHPGIDPHTAQQEVAHSMYFLGCDGSNSSLPTEKQVASPEATQEVQLRRDGQEYTVSVRINDTITLPFVLDTGATDIVIPADVALTLVRAGALSRDDLIGKARYSLANGSEEVNERVIIRKVQVGGYSISDVTALVSPPTGQPLLGESFLSKFGKVTIDYNRLILTLSP